MEFKLREVRVAGKKLFFRQIHYMATTLCVVSLFLEFKVLRISKYPRENWLEVIKNELNSNEEAGTWSVVERPKKLQVIDSHWVFCKKENILYKAGLVVKCFQQRLEEMDFSKIYSLVTKLVTVRMLLTSTVQCGMEYLCSYNLM